MKVIVTGALQATQDELDMLRSMGLDITLHPDERQAVQDPGQFEAAVCNGLFLYNDIQHFTNLKYIQLTSAGMDRVPLEYIRQHGIEIHNAVGVYSVPMAEWTVMRILELYKNAGNLYGRQSKQCWEKDYSWQELAGKTACIVGFGAYGLQTAKRLKAFDVQITVVNRTRKQSPWVDRFYSMEELDDALGQADIVIMAIALTDETHHLMSEKQFAAMKRGSIFVNAARGAIVDEQALLCHLNSGKICGAALDVFENEPLAADSPVWSVQNVIVSPHNSFVGANNHVRLMTLVAENLRGFLK